MCVFFMQGFEAFGSDSGWLLEEDYEQFLRDEGVDGKRDGVSVIRVWVIFLSE